MSGSRINSDISAANIFDEVDADAMEQWKQAIKKITSFCKTDPSEDTSKYFNSCLNAFIELTPEQRAVVQNDVDHLGKVLGHMNKTDWQRSWKKLISEREESIPSAAPHDWGTGVSNSKDTSKNVIYLTDEGGEMKPAGEFQTEVFDKFFEDNTENPTIFYKGGGLSRIVRNALSAVKQPDMQYHLQDRFKWYTLSTKKEKDMEFLITKNVNPIPSFISQMVLANPRKAELPHIHAVINHPIFTKSGELITSQGYIPEAKVYLENDYSGIEILGSVSEAVEIYEQVFEHFPFSDEFSKAVAFSYPLTLLIRHLIAGLVPFFHSGASRAGSGKTKLFDENHRIVFGEPLFKMGIPVKNSKREADHIPSWAEPILERKVGQQLARGRLSWMFDNAANGAELDSPYLCLLATGETIDVKILYEQDFRTIRNRSVVVFTGNNLRFVGDLKRRVVHCILQPETEHPELRKLPNIRDTIQKNRIRLLSCLTTIIDAWFKQGSPTKEISFGSYEEWAGIIGGILQLIGYDDFLPTKIEYSDYDLAIRDFVSNIWQQLGTNRWSAKDVMPIAFQVDNNGKSDGTNILGDLDNLPPNADQYKQYLARRILPNLDGKVFDMDDNVSLRVNRIRNSRPVTYEIKQLLVKS